MSLHYFQACVSAPRFPKRAKTIQWPFERVISNKYSNNSRPNNRMIRKVGYSVIRLLEIFELLNYLITRSFNNSKTAKIYERKRAITNVNQKLHLARCSSRKEQRNKSSAKKKRELVHILDPQFLSFVNE